MRKKMLFVSDHGDPLAKLGGKQSGGQNNYVKQLALSLEDHGWEIDIVTHWCDSSAPRIEHFGKNCRVIRIEAGFKGFISKNEMYEMLSAFYEEMKSALNLKEYDMVHTHYWLSGLLGMRLQRDFGLPFMHTSHSLGWAKEVAVGIPDLRRMKAETAILQTADQVLATTNSEKALIEKFVEHPSPISVIPIGVDKVFQKRQNRGHIRKRLGFQTPLFVFAGRLEETKGIHTLLSAFQRLVHRAGDRFTPQLVLAGGEANAIDFETNLPTDLNLRKAVRGIEQHVIFLGPQNQTQLSLLFNSATATIVPSYYESFGMVAAEAQACGSPVIASKVGGLKNVVQDGYSGLLVESKNPFDLANAMEKLATNASLAHRLGQQAMQVAEREFQWSSISERINSLYEVIISERYNTSISH